MSTLRIGESSVHHLVMSTPPLTSQIVGWMVNGLITILIPYGLIMGFYVNSHYSSLKEESNQGYLHEMICERLEKNFVNCKLQQTDIEGTRTTLFSAPIKSATYSVVTTNVYTCSVSLIKRDGRKISNLELFTNIESIRDCPGAKGVVNQINQYILGDGNQPLSWQRDQRIGDLTQNWIRSPDLMYKLNSLLISGGSIYFFILLIVIFLTTEDFWNLDTRSNSVTYKQTGLFFRSEQKFSFSSLEKIEFYRSMISISAKDLTKDKKKSYNLFFMNEDDKLKVLTFLQDATGLEAQAGSSDD